MAWRLAKSLSVLRAEILARYPGTTVWTIGDQAHASGYSDHNPNSKGVVCAIDVKANGGMSLQAFVDHLIRNPHPNLRYVIYNRKIYQRKNGFKAQVYTGPNAHADHAHASAGDGPDGRSATGYDNTSPWGIATMGKPSAPSTGLVPEPTLREGDTGPRVGHLQRALNEAVNAGLTVDDGYGPKTTAGVKLLQRHARITEDGIYGPNAADALRDLLEDDMPTAEEFAREVWRYKNESLTTRDAYAFLRDTAVGPQILTELKAGRLREEAILAAVKGLNTQSVIAAVNAAAAADAERDAALLAEAAATVRAALDPAVLAAEIAEGLDHELDLDTAERAVETALRKVFGELDSAAEAGA